MKRWPIIRHIRWMCATYRVNKWYENWEKLGYLPVNAQHDYDHCDRIWRGEL
jgi:hypothetical protein